jgi:hypothetical protein
MNGDQGIVGYSTMEPDWFSEVGLWAAIPGFSSQLLRGHGQTGNYKIPLWIKLTDCLFTQSLVSQRFIPVPLAAFSS